jgi:hypothetical protein
VFFDHRRPHDTKPGAAQPRAVLDHVFTYLVIAEDGTSHEHHHRLTGAEPVDDVVRAAVGGLVEHIPVTDQTLTLWCDEEGRLRGRPVNPVGSRLAHLLGGRPARYVGPIVITGNHHAATVSLTTEQVDQLLAALEGCRS